MNKKCILILGGVRSGKSSFAKRLASHLGDKVLFVATAAALDEEMRQRIRKHQKSRPRHWDTLEVHTDLGKRISEFKGKTQVVIIDCITLLINNILEKCKSSLHQNETLEGLFEKEVALEIKRLIECIKRLKVSFIIISNEVGMGIVPVTKTGRIYRDILGKANQKIAQHSDEVYILIAGIPIKVKSL